MSFIPIDDPLAQCEKMWEWENDFPSPKWQIRCPVCQEVHVSHIKDYLFHINVKSKTKYRCDVSFKCINCSAVWKHGIVIPEWLYYRHGSKAYHWREAKNIIKARDENLPYYVVHILIADDPEIPNKWCRKEVTIKTYDDVEQLKNIEGQFVFIDTIYYNPGHEGLKQEVIVAASMYSTCPQMQIIDQVKLADRKLFEF